MLLSWSAKSRWKYAEYYKMYEADEEFTSNWQFVPWEITISDIERKIRISDLRISSLALYHLNYPGSIDGTGLNLSLESNAMQGVVVCDTVSRRLIDELTSSLFIYSDILGQIDNLYHEKLQF